MPKKQGPPTLTQWRRRIENDYDSKPWQLPIFSYGINANIQNVKWRLPKWSGKWEPAVLANFQMSFSKQYTKGGSTFCNIRPKLDHEVVGVLLYCDKASFRKLDIFEGYPEHYQRVLVQVYVDGFELVEAWAYTSRHVGSGAPSKEYYNGVLQGLAEIGAPVEYIKYVKAEGLERIKRQQCRNASISIYGPPG